MPAKLIKIYKKGDKWMVVDSDDLGGGSSNNLGVYATSAELIAAHPSPEDGSYATVIATGTVWFWNGLAWTDSGETIGNMDKTIYDPTNVEGDAFDMDNMNEGNTNKILTETERIKLEGALLSINNLSDVNDTSIALSNLGGQEELVNGTNIKTVNGSTLLGEGDLTITAGGGGGAGDLYLTNTASTIEATYNQISYIPETTEVVNTVTMNSGDGNTLLQEYLFEDEIGETSINAGTWYGELYAGVNSNVGVTALYMEVFTRTIGGVETTLFGGNSPELTTTAGYTDSWTSTQGVFTTNTSDRLGFRIYGKTTSGVNKTISVTMGGSNSSYVKSPLNIRHNNTRNRNADDAHSISAITGLQDALDNAGGGGGAIIDYEDNNIQSVRTIINKPVGQTISATALRITLETLPTGADFQVELLKNGVSEGTVSILTTDTLTNGLYQKELTSFTSGSYTSTDLLTLNVIQIGSTVAGASLTALLV